MVMEFDAKLLKGEIVEALRTRDPQSADNEMRRHVRAGLEDALEGLAREERAMTSRRASRVKAGERRSAG